MDRDQPRRVHVPGVTSEACLGTTVPAAWLVPLYVHAALFIHRLLGGRHWLKRWLERDA